MKFSLLNTIYIYIHVLIYEKFQEEKHSERKKKQTESYNIIFIHRPNYIIKMLYTYTLYLCVIILFLMKIYILHLENVYGKKQLCD